MKSPRPCSFSPQYSSRPSSESACGEEKLLRFIYPSKKEEKNLNSVRAKALLYLKLHSDLKRLVGVLQGLKAHVRVTVESGEVHLYHCRDDEESTMVKDL